MVYDPAGNLVNDGSHPFTYDAENRLTTAGGVTYTYDGDGKRVKKSNGTLYWNGLGWDPLVETDLSGNATEEYVFFNGERVARVDLPANTVEYYFSDHLKSTDIVTNATGGIVRESDYVPYGGEVVISGTDPNRYKFTGKERDPESGLDDFDARFYSSPFGRFMTPDWEAKPTDVPYANFGNPQSLNLYSYVQNNPTTLGDPDGHDTWDFIVGAINATANDVIGTQRDGSGNSDFRAGQMAGDAATAGAGAYETLQNAVGSILFDIGTGGAGALTISAQVALVAVPAVVTTRATANLVTDVKQMSLTKSTTPSGKSSSGQNINAHGEKLGPSKKPMRHGQEHSTTKRAKDAARLAGKQTPIRDVDHFHAVDQNGKKINNGTHHYFRKKKNG
jgi:RHS repeat-associated protein